MNIYAGTPAVEDPFRDVPHTVDLNGSEVPGTTPEPGTPRYFDVAGLLDGTLPEPPAPVVLARGDGHALFYSGQINVLFGDPESGKTWVAVAAAVEQLNRGHRVLWVDLDHNGPVAIVTRLLALGGPASALADHNRFRYTEPDDRSVLQAVVADTITWKPSLAVVDSVGELLPMLGASSNSPDDFTLANRKVLTPLARTGAAVAAVDHLAKGTDSRTSGPGGTAAKRRAVGGVSIRVTVKDAFTPGRGGSAHLAINKDRHGGLRQYCPTGDREPYAGTFVLTDQGDGHMTWSVTAPTATSRNPEEAARAEDVAAVAALEPPATTGSEAQRRLGWRKERALAAFKEWRKSTVPGSHPLYAEPGTVGPDDTVPGSRHRGTEPGTVDRTLDRYRVSGDPA